MMDLLLFPFIFFNLFFVIALLRDDYSIIDVAWGPSFVAICFGALSTQKDISLASLLLILGVSIWALRLGGYILYRNLKSGHEDYRYTEMRKGWSGSIALNAYYRVYLLQWVLSLSIGYPLFLFITSDSTSEISYQQIVGFGVFVIGFLIETLADYQKNKFKQRNSTDVCDIGLWHYSRHPNYFGEALLWWGLFIVISSSVNWYLVIFSPVFLTFLLLKVSGVALLEQKYEGREDYVKYRDQTSAFIPWFKKKVRND